MKLSKAVRGLENSLNTFLPMRKVYILLLPIGKMVKKMETCKWCGRPVEKGDICVKCQRGFNKGKSTKYPEFYDDINEDCPALAQEGV